MADARPQKAKFLRVFEEAITLRPGTLLGPETLSSLAVDSLGLMNLIADIDREFGVAVTPAGIYECKTVDDLFALVGSLPADKE